MPRSLATKPKHPAITIGIDTEYQFNAKTGLNNLLSYQAFVYNPDTGLTFSFIHKPKKNYRGKYPRLMLGEFLGMVLLAARKKRVIDDYPRSIVLAGHFIRADLCMFEDFHRYLKRKLAAVRGTHVTTSRRLPLRLVLPDGERRVTLSVVDTMLLSPPKTSLDMIGEQLGLPKLKIMPGYLIEEMERYRTEQPEAFDAYALRDAEIAARYSISIFELFSRLGISGAKPTLGSAGVAMFKLLFPNKEAWLEFLGQDLGSNGRVWKPSADALIVSCFTPGAYHGGLNSIYHVGYSPLGREVLDVDLVGAYTTALAAIRCPDWASSRAVRSLDDLAVVDEAMTFAQVKFRFPTETKFPCLPIRSSNQHGLIYPLEGESWCCGPELVIARGMGCSITVIHGYRVDWLPDRANPFAVFARNIAEGRKAAKAAGDAMLGLVFKLLGNTLYGKVSQGVGSKRPVADDVEDHRIFDTETGEMADLPPSSITCPAIAAWATSLVRAVMLEALHRLPPTAIALQATTDGILFVGSETDIVISGPVARAFRRARVLVTGEQTDSKIWEVKHRIPRVITFKTRGMISVVQEDWVGEVHLAKAGAHFPDHLQTEVESTRYAEQVYRGRTYDTMYERKDLTSLSEQHKTGCDLTATIRTVRLNWDYDFKNEPVGPVCDVEGVISFATRPWRTVKYFEACRKDFEDWQRSQTRSLKTARDYLDFVEWVELRPTRKLLRTRLDGVLPNLARVIAAEAMRRPWNERPSYKVIAEVLARATGRPVTAHTINDIRRRRDLIPHQCLTMLSADDIEFARVYGTNPVAVEQLRSAILPGSIAERQFADICEKRLPAPAPAIETEHINGFDYVRIFEERRRLLMPNVGHDEARFRAIEFTVNFCCTKLGIDFEAAKSTVLAALGVA